VGQEHALEVPLDPGPVDEALMVRLRADFDRRSEEAYAFSLPVAVEIVSARVSVSLPAPPVRWTSAGRGSPVGRSFGPREVDLDVHGGRRRALVLERSSLEPGRPVEGPCVIEEEASTTLVLPGQRVEADDLGNLIIREGS
jgi:N-methylhydantoinase A